MACRREAWSARQPHHHSPSILFACNTHVTHTVWNSVVPPDLIMNAATLCRAAQSATEDALHAELRYLKLTSDLITPAQAVFVW